MGLSASQMRFLMLTSRKTDVEFQGQQINQQRTTLAQESQDLFNDLLNMEAPSSTSFILDSSNDTFYSGMNYWVDSGNMDGKVQAGEIKEWDGSGTTPSDSAIYQDNGYVDSSGILQANSSSDDGGNSVNDLYEIAQYEYNKKYNEINLEIDRIEAMDRTLELRLKNLDTQQEALATELESVKKVIDKNIEQTFKTFA